MRDVILNVSPDIVHVHHMELMVPYVYHSLISLGRGIPIVATVHSTHAFEKYGQLGKYEEFRKLVLSNLDMVQGIIFVSRQSQEELIKLLGNKPHGKPTFVIPNGFDPYLLPIVGTLKAREYLGIPLNAKVIFSLGNLIERKGFYYLIQAMKTVVHHRDDVLCFIGGKGPLKEVLQEQISELNLQDHIKLIGFVPDEELKYWMNAADLFVLPSLSEGNPTVMFEALGVGLPFVGTAVGGVPEVITSKDYGLLCEPADPECLAEKILIALEKEWDREEIREYAKQFTWENIAKRVLEVYMNL